MTRFLECSIINLYVKIETCKVRELMIKSMTGFGRCEIAEADRKFTVEMKGVNHRYLDVNIRMPKKLNFFESAIRNLLKQYVQRGKIDIFIGYEDMTESQMTLKYNQKLAEEYMASFKQMEEQFGLDNDVRVSTLARCPEVLTMEEQSVDEEELWSGLEKAMKGACEQFVQTKTTEGENLKKDIIGKLDGMLEVVARVEERSPQIVAEYREKLETKVKELLGDTQIDEGRIAAEVVIFSDKICTDEEVVRLRSHIIHMKETLQSEEAGIGRKLDFITQEMNRVLTAIPGIDPAFSQPIRDNVLESISQIKGQIVVAAVRAALQLTAVSSIIVLAIQQLWSSALFVLAMFTIAVFTTTGRVGTRNVWWWSALAMASGALPVFALPTHRELELTQFCVLAPPTLI